MGDSRAIGPTFDQAKNHNKRFGEFEFEYFGDSDVVNKLVDASFFADLSTAFRVNSYLKIFFHAKLTFKSTHSHFGSSTGSLEASEHIANCIV